MALKIGDNISYQGKQPNFSRDTFTELQEMVRFPETSLDEGHISLCLETGKRYIFYSTNTIDPVLGRWRLVVDTALDATSENPVQNKVIYQKFQDLETDTSESHTELEQRVIDNELVNSASLNDLNDRLNDTEEVLTTAINEIKSDLDTEYTINGHPLNEKSINLTAEDIGLGNYEDYTNPLDLPISYATEEALETKVDKVEGSRLITETEATQLADHLEDNNNPHQVTKSQLGLGSYPENPLDLPISTATQNALDSKLPKTAKVNGHPFSNDSVPEVTLSKADVGLGKVDDTADLNKPISLDTQEALDKKVDKVEGSRLLTSEEAEIIAGIEDNEKVTAAALIDLENRKVDKTSGGRLINEEEIARIAGLANKEKVIAAAFVDLEDRKVDKVEGSRLINEDEIEEIAGIKDTEKVVANAILDLNERLIAQERILPITHEMIDYMML